MGANPLATVCKANQPFVLVDSPKHDCKRLLLNKNPFKGFIYTLRAMLTGTSKKG
jgi:hypothetical protein